jgi:LacI family transcriptional regulator
MTAPTARLRIGDVAKLAGVSPATVSRVLSGSQTVSPESRERVLAIVSRFDYQPSRLARNLRQGRAEVVGVVVSDIENPHFASMVRAIEDALYRRGKRVLLCNTSEDAAKQASYLEVMAAERVLGVLLSPSDPGDPEIGRVLDLGIPVVAFDRTVGDPRADSVTAGNVEAARQAVRLLAGRGHRRIGFVSGRAGVQTGDDRLAGYRAEARAAGIEERVAGGEFSLEGGRAATAELLAARPRPTALLIANNQMSLGALELLRERGLAIPGDIAVVAFDDPPWANLIDPPLTALAQPLRAMADAAVDLLFERMAAGRRQPAHLVFEFELRVRRSCGTAHQEHG